MQFELEAKKSLGQNFLKNTTIIKKMVAECLSIAKTYTGKSENDASILEIGPGTGALTEYLLETNLHLQAIEADDRAIPLLTEKFQSYIEKKQFSLIHQDIRTYDLENTHAPYIIVANIPYYLTGYIIRKFLESNHQPIAMILMVQKEVAVRILDKKHSLAALGVLTYGTPRILTHVSRGNFVPVPNVDSSVLVIENIQHNAFTNTTEEKTYWELAKKAFGNKRKQLGGTILKNIQDDRFDSYRKKRPEDLQVEDWIYISKIYTEGNK
jgi:16S rRNA (adenine1518-N6/adenine1519-N6)-dimethyltransferase